MTAKDANTPRSDNSGSGDTDDEHMPLAEVVQARPGGWIVLEELIAELGLEAEAARRIAQRCVLEGKLKTASLGRKTIVMTPETKPAEAVAELFDRAEQERIADSCGWRNWSGGDRGRR